MRRRFIGNIDLLLAAAFVLSSFVLLFWQRQHMDVVAVATLVGALIGGAALLFGNWTNRRDERQRASAAQIERQDKLKALITVELVNVACGLIDTKRLVDAALSTLRDGGHVGERLDMSTYYPRQMPFCDHLGVELLTLEQPAVDALATLRSNLLVTRGSMEEISRGAHFGLLRITALCQEIDHDMGVLADAFEHIAPTRKLELPGQPPELASAMLKRMRKQAVPAMDS